MKLIRFGAIGKEKPGVLIGEKRYDVSSIVKDFDEAFFDENGLEKLQKALEHNPVLPEVDAMLPTLFYPTSATDVRDGGQVIRVMGSISSAARHGVVTINRGTQDGVQVGHVFSTAQQGEVVKDPKTKEAIKLPNQRVGNIMIFKAFNQLSYGYVLDSELPIKVGAAITPPAMSE